jgi:hypothetical protein
MPELPNISCAGINKTFDSKKPGVLPFSGLAEQNRSKRRSLPPRARIGGSPDGMKRTEEASKERGMSGEVQMHQAADDLETSHRMASGVAATQPLLDPHPRGF